MRRRCALHRPPSRALVIRHIPISYAASFPSDLTFRAMAADAKTVAAALSLLMLKPRSTAASAAHQRRINQ
jgi:hypothetical protein